MPHRGAHGQYAGHRVRCKCGEWAREDEKKSGPRPWARCTTPRCPQFGVHVYSGSNCLACDKPLPWPQPEPEDFDMRLLERALQRAKGEVRRIEERIAELSKLSR